MKYLTKTLTLGALTLTTFLQAQVQFKIERMGETNNFMVSAVPSETYSNPMNITSTAQVTLLMPTGEFELDKVVNLYPNANWRLNGRTNAPKENSSYDYIYFGLENLGTNALEFKKGKETPLFLIQSKQCDGTLHLMDNEKDPFVAPNSRNVNVGNQITILGAGGDAFKGLVAGKQEAACLKKQKSDNLNPTTIRISPNVAVLGTPIKFEFFITDKDNEKGELVIYDANGRSVYLQDIKAKKGYNTIDADVDHLVKGIYYVVLTGVKQFPMSERLVITE
jgi:hypothetical protein